VESILRTILLYLSSAPWARYLAMRFPVAKRVASRFVAGESLDEALGVAARLKEEGFLVSLDLLGENVDGLGEAERAVDEVIQAVHALQELGYACNLSVKLTQLGLDIDPEATSEHLRRIAREIGDSPIRLRVDMEGSKYTETTLNIVVAAHQEYPVIATVLQSYLYRTVDDIRRLNSQGIAARLCKGAYAEPAEVAFQSKSAVDENYLRSAEDLLLNGTYPAFATHDEAMIQGVLEIVARLGLNADDFEFQMLFGIRQDRQKELLSEGWRVRLYVPYGRSWYPYFMRRLAERPANLAFFLTALVKG
jgi:proline dehydrogenase